MVNKHWLTLKKIIYFWLCWVFDAVQGLLSICRTWVSHCGGFSSCRTWALGCMTSAVVARSTWPVESPWTRDWTRVPCIGSQILSHWITGEIWLGFNLKSPAALAPNKSVLSFEALKPGIDFLSLAMKLLDGIFLQYKTISATLKICYLV